MSNKNKLVLLFLLLLLAALVLLLLPTLLRGAPFLEESFKQLTKEPSTPFDYLLLFIPGAFFFLPIAFGIANLILAYFLLNEKFGNKDSLIFIILAIGTPTFVATHTFGNPYSMIFFLNLLGILFLNRNNLILSGLAYTLLAFFGTIPFLGSLLMLFAYHQKFDAKFTKVVLIPLVAFFLTLFTLTSVSIPLVFNLKGLISEAGSRTAIGVFGMVLAGVGWAVHWKKKKTTFILLALLLICGVFFSEVNYFIYVVAVVLGGIGARFLYYKQWSSEVLKQFTMFIILLGVLFTGIAYEKEILEENPTPAVVEGLRDLATQSKGVVFTDESRIPWVEGLTHHSAISNEAVLHSYDLEFVRAYFDQQRVAYVFVDEELFRGDVWNVPREELLFLLQDERYFYIIFENEEVTIWVYTP